MKPKTIRRVYGGEAIVALSIARLAVRFVSPERILSWSARSPRRIRRFGVQTHVQAVSWAVETIGSRPWMNARCLPRALAAQAMLRRRGIPAKLCLGVARDGEGLAAHAWLELGQDMVVGGAQAPQFTRLVSFGDGRQTPARLA